MTFCVLTGFISHETATFSRRPTTLDDFKNSMLLFGHEIATDTAGINVEPAGFIKAAELYNWRLIHTVAATATPSGPVTGEAWTRCADAILDAARSEQPTIDGVLLGLHGAMATEDDFDAEGLLLSQLRALLGPDIPIAVTLDLHANVTDRMVANADILCAYRTYPHVDQIATVLRAADLLERTLQGEISPYTLVARRTMLTGLDHGRTTTENPMTQLLAEADVLEARDEKLLTISLCAGFRLTDLDQAGPSVTITSDGDDLAYAVMADHFMDYAWAQRHFDSNRYLSVDACMAELKTALPETRRTLSGPIVIADHADNPGAGAYGDSTFLLKGLLDSKITNAAFATIYDPHAVRQLTDAGTGAEVSLFIGGKTDPKFGPPLFVSGRVANITDGRYQMLGPYARGSWQNLGPLVVLNIAGIDVLIASHCVQITELETFTHAGIDPRVRDVIALKSMQHFRAAFEPIASQLLIVDCGALASEDISRLPYKNLRRPIYPLDLD
ncbi:MAG: M81 family metallopeptidase [Rhodospirillales bacterium]|nr:M81 family metallopeptidase [Rhodospirillales bacterium]